MAKRETRFQCRYVSAISTDLLPYPLGEDIDNIEAQVAALCTLSITNKRLNIPEKELMLNLGQIDQDTLHKTLNATTQLAVRDTEKDIYARYKTSMIAFKYHMICFSDTAKPKTPSFSGKKYFQVTTTNFGLMHVYCTTSKDQVKEFVEQYGIPRLMVTDNAFEERTGEWGKLCNSHVIEQRTTEPHTPNKIMLSARFKKW